MFTDSVFSKIGFSVQDSGSHFGSKVRSCRSIAAHLKVFEVFDKYLHVYLLSASMFLDTLSLNLLESCAPEHQEWNQYQIIGATAIQKLCDAKYMPDLIVFQHILALLECDPLFRYSGFCFSPAILLDCSLLSFIVSWLSTP